MPSWIPKINRLWKQGNDSETPDNGESSDSSNRSAEEADETDNERADNSVKAAAEEEAALNKQTDALRAAKKPSKAPSRPGSAPPPPASLPPPIIPTSSDTHERSRDSFIGKIPSLGSRPPRASNVPPPLPVTRSSLSGNPPSMGLVGPADLDQVRQELGSRYDEFKKALDASDERIQRLEAALEMERDERAKAFEERDRRIQVLEKGLKDEQDAWNSQVEERDEALFDLKLELETENNRLSERVDNQHVSVQTLEATIKELREKVEELQRAIGDARALDVTVGDDLTRIKGVGPRFERALKAQGVTTYEQIANWTEEDIDNIAALIRVKPGRIERERWVDHARELLQLSQ